MLKKYYVIWTYLGYHSELLEIEAPTANDAKNKVTWLYGDDFHKKASVYVFDKYPVKVVTPYRHNKR